MKESLLKACDFIATSNRKLTSMKVMYPKENKTPIDSVIESFFDKFPDYKEKIIIRGIEYEINKEDRDNPELIRYFILIDKVYLNEKEKKAFPLILKKCNFLKRKKEIVDILDVKVSNLDELKVMIKDFCDQNPLYENEFSFNAEKDNNQYFISMMNIEEYEKK